jgi:hypothetical protein
VSSSLGTEERPVLEGRVRSGDVEKDVRLGVTDRSERDLPVLSGRRDLTGMHVVVGEEAGRPHRNAEGGYRRSVE